MIEGYKKDIQEIYQWYKKQPRIKQAMIKYISCMILIVVSFILKVLVSGVFFIPFALGIGIIAHDVIRQQRQEMKADTHALEDSRKKLAEAKARSRKAYEERKQTEHDLLVQRQKLLVQRSGIEQKILDQRARIAKESSLRSLKLKSDFKKQVDNLKDEIKFIKSGITKKNRYYG